MHRKPWPILSDIMAHWKWFYGSCEKIEDVK